jgi:hypothetical protein
MIACFLVMFLVICGILLNVFVIQPIIIVYKECVNLYKWWCARRKRVQESKRMADQSTSFPNRNGPGPTTTNKDHHHPTRGADATHGHGTNNGPAMDRPKDSAIDRTEDSAMDRTVNAAMHRTKAADVNDVSSATQKNYSAQDEAIVKEVLCFAAIGGNFIEKVVASFCVLGIPITATPATLVEVKKAFHRRSRQVHPDKNRAPGAKEASAAVNNAKQLCDEYVTICMEHQQKRVEEERRRAEAQQRAEEQQEAKVQAEEQQRKEQEEIAKQKIEMRNQLIFAFAFMLWLVRFVVTYPK